MPEIWVYTRKTSDPDQVLELKSSWLHVHCYKGTSNKCWINKIWWRCLGYDIVKKPFCTVFSAWVKKTSMRPVQGSQLCKGLSKVVNLRFGLWTDLNNLVILSGKLQKPWENPEKGILMKWWRKLEGWKILLDCLWNWRKSG